MFCLLLAGEGNVVPDGSCSPGYYCPGGQDTPTPPDLLCWKGHYCTIGTTTPDLCPNGTYQFDTGRDYCDDCPEGYYCDPAEGKL